MKQASLCQKTAEKYHKINKMVGLLEAKNRNAISSLVDKSKIINSIVLSINVKFVQGSIKTKMKIVFVCFLEIVEYEVKFVKVNIASRP